MANIYQTGSKIVSKVISKGVPKKESVLAEKLGTAISAKEARKVSPEIQSRLGAMDALKLLQEEGTPTFKTTAADLQSFAKDNPNASPEELAAMYRSATPEKPTPYRMKEKVEPVSAPREIEDPASQERIYEAYGRAGDVETNFADDGVGLEGLVSRPQDEIVSRGIGGLPTETPLSSPKPAPSRGLTTTQKVGAGMAVAGAAGMATRGEDKKEEPLPGFNVTPRITSDGEFAPSTPEMNEAIGKGQDAIAALWSKYDRLNEELKQRPLTAYRSGASIQVQRAEQFLNEMRPAKEVKPTGPGILARPPEETPPIPEKEKPAIVKPAPPLGGVSTTEPSAQVKATKATVPGQVQTAQAAKTSVDSLKEKLLSGAPLGRGDLLSVLKEIEQIKPGAVTKDTTLINQLKAAREDARTAYREQANRNEWYEVAQTLGNAVANFIAAQRGVADRALALPQIDYGERTGRALREYQTELGSIGEQEQALERGTEKQIAAAERAAETSRRSWQKYLTLGEKQIEAAERKAERDKDLATKVALAKADDERSLKVATAKAEEKKQEAAKSNAKDYLSAVKSQVSLYDNQIEDAQRKLKAAQTFSTTDQKNFNKNFQEYMTSLSTAETPITEEMYQKKGFFGTPSFSPDMAKKDASTRVAELIKEIGTLSQKKNAAMAEEAALLKGRTTTPPAQAGQAPASGGTVVTRKNIADKARQTGLSETYIEQQALAQGFTIQD